MSHIVRKQKNNTKKKFNRVAIALLAVAIVYIVGIFLQWNSSELNRRKQSELVIPEYAGNPYVEINDNIPFFTEEDMNTVSFKSSSILFHLHTYELLNYGKSSWAVIYDLSFV